MITVDTEGAFREMVQTTKPEGTVTINTYNTFGPFPVTIRQKILKWIAPDDPDRRVQLGLKYFPGPFKKLDKRYCGMNSKQSAYDTFGIPYEEVHTAGEVLKWFKRANVRYKGSFAPLRVRDYFSAFSLDEYKEFCRAPSAVIRPPRRSVISSLKSPERKKPRNSRRNSPVPVLFPRGFVNSCGY